MKRIVFFFNIKSFVELRLAGQFIDNGDVVYSKISKSFFDVVYDIRNIMERKEFIRILECIHRITSEMGGNEDYKQICKEQEVVVWLTDSFCEPVFQFQPFSDEVRKRQEVKKREEDRKYLLGELKNIKVSELNIITSMYRDREKELSCLLENIMVPVNFYYVPCLTYDVADGEMDLIKRCAYWLAYFIRWVELRIPDYFLKHKLNLQYYKNKVLTLANEMELVNWIMECYNRKGKNNKYWFQSGVKVLAEFFLSKVCEGVQNDSIEKIQIEWVDSFKKQNLIDNLFQRIMESYLSFLVEEQRNEEHCSTTELASDAGWTLFACTKDSAVKCLLEKRRTVHKNVKVITIDEEQKLTYYTVGNGIPIVIVNALGAFVEAWDNLIYELAKNYYVVIWDIRGVDTGNQELFAKGLFGVESQVKDIERVVANEKLQDFHLLAWCSGAKSSVIYSVRNPDKVKSLMFLCGDFAPYDGMKKISSKFQDNLPLVKELLDGKSNLLKIYMNLIFDGIFRNPPEEIPIEEDFQFFEVLPVEYRDYLLALFQSEQQTANFLRICIEYYEHDITEYLQQIEHNVLLITAEHDKVAPMEQSYWAYQQIEHAQIYCLPAAVHVIMMERSREIMNYVKYHIDMCEQKEKGNWK
ncbi:alpha/beta fold hydrolase [[Clostridium] polysaccharolyticum]|uniref:Pimeloyl-ACP methyl ester carboxylesterase n=1 Tax=[Clostridium] polysaccharolyticum TaxID=29364 RepID=A0A1I0C3T1_9FIRM|nr:alpha/beta hydrolase [[Clostridium] polysaccharolyticum]SET14032.1 Pimeloyl-ACP methyl ester carboxylesterase [[Clostridium] polysaccharolyticum]